MSVKITIREEDTDDDILYIVEDAKDKLRLQILMDQIKKRTSSTSISDKKRVQNRINYRYDSCVWLAGIYRKVRNHRSLRSV